MSLQDKINAAHAAIAAAQCSYARLMSCHATRWQRIINFLRAL